MNLPDAAGVKLREKEPDLWSGSSLASTVRSDGKKRIKIMMEEAAFRPEQSV